MGVISVGLGVVIAVIFFVALMLFILFGRLFKKVEQGKALIVSKVRKVDVTFTGTVVLPILHRSETMDISVKTIEIRRAGNEGLICRDNIRADIRITFFVRVNKTVEDVIKVAQAIGTERASHDTTLQELFNAKFSEALKTVGKQLDFVDLYTHRDEFRDRIIQVIGTDLNGYSLEDAAIDYLEQTPMAQLDPANILDAQGIRKITELTAIEHVRTNEFQRNEEKEITRQNVDAREAILELERRQADAETKQKREIETMRAREEAETAKVQAEERLKASTAHIRTEEQVGIQHENKAREVAVAEKNKERVIAIETERRAIADLVRERVAVEKTVAEQEESIKRLRAVEEAERERQAIIIHAEAQAQELLVKDIKAAEASEQAAQHKAREELLLAETRQQTAELDARAKIRLAEGTQAEAAAKGLADVQVRERDADAIEKVGRAEAVVDREKALAEAEGIKEKLKGEAEGLEHKANAMSALDAVSREHEEYRLRLEAEKSIRLAGIDSQRQIAESQAIVLAAGLEKANIDIVGGDTQFFQNVVGAITAGKSLDGFVEHSDVASELTKQWRDGTRSFPEDVTKVLSSISTGDIQNLAASAMMSQIAKSQDK